MIMKVTRNFIDIRRINTCEILHWLEEKKRWLNVRDLNLFICIILKSYSSTSITGKNWYWVITYLIQWVYCMCECAWIPVSKSMSLYESNKHFKKSARPISHVVFNYSGYARCKPKLEIIIRCRVHLNILNCH